jgi:outer membrane lipoprotein-sorting protein
LLILKPNKKTINPENLKEMKRTIIAIVGVAILSMGTAHAQELKEILDKYFKTIGQEKILNVQTQVSSGKILQMGMEIPFKTITKRPNKAYMEMEIQGTSVKMGYDGEKGWAIQPWTGSVDPVDLVGQDLRPVKEMADFDGSLWNYAEKGHQLELLGTEDMDGTKVYVLKLTQKDGYIFHYYLDSEKYLALKMRTKMVVNGMETEMEALMSDFTNVDGYLMPFKTEQSFDGQQSMTMIYETVKFDQNIDDSIFRKPEVAPAEQQ